MARGGARPGSGRPKGAITKIDPKTGRKAAKSELMPREVMLHHMRQLHLECLSLQGSNERDDIARASACRNLAIDIAAKVAPYVHAKLVSSEVSGKDGGAIQVAVDMSDHELARRVAILLAPKPLALKDIPALLPAPEPVDVAHSVVDSAQVEQHEADKPSDNSGLERQSTT